MATETKDLFDLPSLSELGGCIFGRGVNRNGYSQIYSKGKQVAHHRLVYEQHYGEIPKGFHVDHICHNVAVKHGMCRGQRNCVHRSCINPNHLRALSPKDNQLSGLRGLRNRPFCGNGHPLNDETIGVRKRKNGTTGDYCKECHRNSTYKAMQTFRKKLKAQKEGE